MIIWVNLRPFVAHENVAPLTDTANGQHQLVAELFQSIDNSLVCTYVYNFILETSSCGVVASHSQLASLASG